MSTASRGKEVNVRVKSGPSMFFKVIYPTVIPLQISYNRSAVTVPAHLHYHPEIELHFIKRGNSRYLIDGKLYVFQSNSMLIIQPRRVHRFLHQPGVLIEQWRVIFDLDLLKGRPSFDFIRKLPTLIRFSVAEMNELEFRLRMMANENLHEEALKKPFIINELDQFAIRIKWAGKETDTTPYNFPSIKKALDFIEAHYREPLSIFMLAKIASLSPSHFSHLFKHCTRMGVKQYILHCRIAEAKTLLESDPNQKLAPLAEQLGFSDLSLFNHCFLRFTSMTPSGFRARFHKKTAGITKDEAFET